MTQIAHPPTMMIKTSGMFCDGEDKIITIILSIIMATQSSGNLRRFISDD